MRSFITFCLCMLNAAVLFAIPQAFPLKIISPSPHCNLKFGASVNIIVEIPVGSIPSSKGITLGFSLNASSANSNGTLLGLLDTTYNPFSSKTGQLVHEFKIPSNKTFYSTSTNNSLVVSYYVPNVTTHDLASVPVTLIDGHKSQPARLYVEVINIPKSEVNASISAKGHNTGDTIPRIGPTGGEQPKGTTNSSTGVVNVPENPTVTNLTTHQISNSGSNLNAANVSGATRTDISAVLFAIITLSIFSSII